jgi:hypothetical protein
MTLFTSITRAEFATMPSGGQSLARSGDLRQPDAGAAIIGGGRTMVRNSFIWPCINIGRWLPDRDLQHRVHGHSSPCRQDMPSEVWNYYYRRRCAPANCTAVPSPVILRESGLKKTGTHQLFDQLLLAVFDASALQHLVQFFIVTTGFILQNGIDDGEDLSA